MLPGSAHTVSDSQFRAERDASIAEPTTSGGEPDAAEVL